MLLSCDCAFYIKTLVKGLSFTLLKLTKCRNCNFMGASFACIELTL